MEVNISTRFTLLWVLKAYAHVASCFGATDAPDFMIKLAGGQYRVDTGKWRSF